MSKLVKTWRATCAALMAMVAASCASHAPLAPETAITGDADAYFLVDVHPGTAGVGFADGRIEGGNFYVNGMIVVNQTYSGAPHDGYVLAKAGPATLQGLRFVQAEAGTFSTVYMPCQVDGAKTLTFPMVPGKVVYAGGITISRSGDSSRVGFSNDFAKARAYIQSHYPQLADKLIAAQAQLLPAKQC